MLSRSLAMLEGLKFGPMSMVQALLLLEVQYETDRLALVPSHHRKGILSPPEGVGTVAFAFRMLVRVLGCASPGAKEGFQVSARMQLHVTHDSYVLRLSNKLGIKDMMHCLLARQSAEIPS